MESGLKFQENPLYTSKRGAKRRARRSAKEYDYPESGDKHLEGFYEMPDSPDSGLDEFVKKTQGRLPVFENLTNNENSEIYRDLKSPATPKVNKNQNGNNIYNRVPYIPYFTSMNFGTLDAEYERLIQSLQENKPEQATEQSTKQTTFNIESEIDRLLKEISEFEPKSKEQPHPQDQTPVDAFFSAIGSNTIPPAPPLPESFTKPRAKLATPVPAPVSFWRTLHTTPKPLPRIPTPPPLPPKCVVSPIEQAIPIPPTPAPTKVDRKPSRYANMRCSRFGACPSIIRRAQFGRGQSRIHRLPTSTLFSKVKFVDATENKTERQATPSPSPQTKKRLEMPRTPSESESEEEISELSDNDTSDSESDSEDSLSSPESILYGQIEVIKKMNNDFIQKIFRCEKISDIVLPSCEELHKILKLTGEPNMILVVFHEELSKEDTWKSLMSDLNNYWNDYWANTPLMKKVLSFVNTVSEPQNIMNSNIILNIMSLSQEIEAFNEKMRGKYPALVKLKGLKDVLTKRCEEKGMPHEEFVKMCMSLLEALVQKVFFAIMDLPETDELFREMCEPIMNQFKPQIEALLTMKSLDPIELLKSMMSPKSNPTSTSNTNSTPTPTETKSFNLSDFTNLAPLDLSKIGCSGRVPVLDGCFKSNVIGTSCHNSSAPCCFSLNPKTVDYEMPVCAANSVGQFAPVNSVGQSLLNNEDDVKVEKVINKEIDNSRCLVSRLEKMEKRTIHKLVDNYDEMSDNFSSPMLVVNKLIDVKRVVDGSTKKVCLQSLLGLDTRMIQKIETAYHKMYPRDRDNLKNARHYLNYGLEKGKMLAVLDKMITKYRALADDRKIMDQMEELGEEMAEVMQDYEEVLQKIEKYESWLKTVQETKNNIQTLTSMNANMELLSEAEQMPKALQKHVEYLETTVKEEKLEELNELTRRVQARFNYYYKMSTQITKMLDFSSITSKFSPSVVRGEYPYTPCLFPDFKPHWPEFKQEEILRPYISPVSISSPSERVLSSNISNNQYSSFALLNQMNQMNQTNKSPFETIPVFDVNKSEPTTTDEKEETSGFMKVSPDTYMKAVDMVKAQGKEQKNLLKDVLKRGAFRNLENIEEENNLDTISEDTNRSN